jgi:hypothetical protein
VKSGFYGGRLSSCSEQRGASIQEEIIFRGLLQSFLEAMDDDFLVFKGLPVACCLIHSYFVRHYPFGEWSHCK